MLLVHISPAFLMCRPLQIKNHLALMAQLNPAEKPDTLVQTLRSATIHSFRFVATWQMAAFDFGDFLSPSEQLSSSWTKLSRSFLKYLIAGWSAQGISKSDHRLRPRNKSQFQDITWNAEIFVRNIMRSRHKIPRTERVVSVVPIGQSVCY